MKVLIIGGGGFLGRKLARALADRQELRGARISSLALADLAAPALIDAPFPVEGTALDITDAAATRDLLSARFDVIYHLAAVVSGQAEAEFEIGMSVNLMGSINVFDAARAAGNQPVLVFTSSIAVYGGTLPEPVEDSTALTPQNSYGAQKAAAELLVSDYARKGFFDGRSLRLPTISIRPGAPNKAASSFMSSIFREPLQGESAVCPVAPDFRAWYQSPRRCIENLIIGAEIDAARFGTSRSVMLPGQSYQISDMIDALGRVAGAAAVERIRFEPDPAIQRIVGGWPPMFDTRRALELGFVRDESFEDHIRFFLEDDCVSGAT